MDTQARFLDLSLLSNEAEMIAGGWCGSGGSDHVHLAQAGYEQRGRDLAAAIS